MPKAIHFVAFRRNLGSVSRHAENCLSLEVSALIKGKKIHGAINFNSEIEKQVYFAKELITASREYLSDEYGNITLVPRSTEIEVMYDDFSDLNNQGEPKKKTATLSALLIRAEAGNIKPLKITAKHIDIRQFALNAISTGSDVLDKVAKVQGIYQKERTNNQDVELADRYLKLADEWVITRRLQKSKRGAEFHDRTRFDLNRQIQPSTDERGTQLKHLSQLEGLYNLRNQKQGDESGEKNDSILSKNNGETAQIIAEYSLTIALK